MSLQVKTNPKRNISVTPIFDIGVIAITSDLLQETEEVEVRILDTDGELLDVSLPYNFVESNKIEVDIKNLKRGIYYFRFSNGKTYLFKKIIVQ